MAMKLYLAGFYYTDIWTDSERAKVVGIFFDIDAAKRAAEEAARANGHGTPFVRKYLTGIADPAKWDAKPDWIGETIYEKKEAKAQ